MASTPRKYRPRGLVTVPLYAAVEPQVKEKFDALAEATGSPKNLLIEALIQHVELDERGLPVWWEPSPADNDDQGELDIAM